ncbi:hypothetical protein CIPAW_16G113000 [Carya illinoinensis]|uniref:TIR domain-containing protein n=1 Tax=Carya illinoinensis TaxID=32201 RepID=A0A8T1N6J3_CARIL|nr:hypothetical protein CIPAW_16G113000 [Carya illinoinensis]
MAFSSPSSSPSLPSISRWAYDVFLSFRKIDTYDNFAYYLYYALCRRGIKIYRDDEDSEIERGEVISPSPTALKAIEDSKIIIIILSPNYVSSWWCLEELTKILKCKEIVLPVFYDVNPSEVRNQRKSFGEALAKH